jgi:hypothetical protein
MTTQAIERRIHIAAPDAPSAFALERRLAHLHAGAVCVHGVWAVELYDDADQLEEIEAAVRHWLRDRGEHSAHIEVNGETVEVTT